MKAYDHSIDTRLFPVVIRLLRMQSRKQWMTLLWGMLCMLVMAGTTALIVNYMKPIIDDVLVGKSIAKLYSVSGLVLLTFLIKSAASYGESVAMGKVGQRLIANLQVDMYHHILRFAYPFFQEHKSGTLVARFINDVRLLENTMTQTVTSLVRDLLMVVSLGSLLFYYDWRLASFAVLVFPVAMLPVSKLGRRLRKTSHNVQSHVGELTEHLMQSFQGIRLVKAYDTVEYEHKRVRDIVGSVLDKAIRAIRIKAMSAPIMEFLGGLAIVAVIMYWGYKIIYHEQTMGEFFAFITGLLMMYEPAKRVAKFQNQLQESLAAASRVFELLDHPVEPGLLDTSGARTPLKGAIAFENVTFGYVMDEPVIVNLNLEIAKGECVALVGPSGGGKTTLLNMLMSFLEPHSGTVKFDGVPSDDYALDHLRRSISFVSQDVTLFDDTVAANIGLGALKGTNLPSQKSIEAAAKEAAAHDFISKLPQGYQTMVGERGARLSGGQRQRIALARALVRQSPILLLDEATSALDTVSEQIIQDSLETMRGKRTMVIVAHRLSTVQHADRIVVVDKGRVVASGPHEELLKSSELYQRLCQQDLSKTS